MAELVPVDHDPFAGEAKASSGPQLVPVDHDPFAEREKTFVEKTPLVANFPESYGKARSDATGAMSRGVEQLSNVASGAGKDVLATLGLGPRRTEAEVSAGNKTMPFFGDRPELGGITASEGVRGLGNLIAGGVGYVTSPIMGAIDAGAGKPVEELTGGKVPREYTNFAASLAVPYMGLTNVSKAAPAVSARPIVGGGQESVRAAAELTERGMPVDVPRAIASDSKVVQQAGARMADVPFVGDDIGTATQRTVEQLGAAKANLSGGLTAESAGQTASQGITGWVTGKSKDLLEKVYGAVDAVINPNVKTDLVNTRALMAEILAKRENAAIQGGSGAVAQVRQAVGKPGGPVTQTVADATGELIERTQRPGGLNYQGIKDLRSKLGEMTPQEMVAQGLDKTEVKRLYGALTEDLKAAARNAGGERGAALWERANKVASLVAERREALAKLVGKDGSAAPAAVFEKLTAAAKSGSRQDSVLLAQARRVMGDDWQDVAQGIIEGMGKGPNGEFSPTHFINNYRGKSGLSAPGRDILFGESGNLRQSLDEIAAVSQRFVDLKHLANPSKSGRTATFALSGGAAIKASTALLAGAWVEPLTFISSVIGGTAMSKILANPATASSAAKYTRAYAAVARNQSPTNVSALARASRNFGATIESNMKMPNPANDLMNVLGPRRTAASDRQQQQETD